MAKELLPDELWQEIEPLLPPPPPPSPKGGRPPVDNRKALAGILFVNRTGIPWQALPTEASASAGPRAGAASTSGPTPASGRNCTSGCSTDWARPAG